jgi:hypothetical protein
MADDRSRSNRDPYRDNDDVREPLEGSDRLAPDPDSKSEARGDARDNIGNTARGTDAPRTGEQHPRDAHQPPPARDEYDDDLRRPT